jgi:hypothetical protein
MSTGLNSSKLWVSEVDATSRRSTDSDGPEKIIVLVLCCLV